MAEIKRILQDEILRRIKPQKVMLLFGARRVGKSYIAREFAYAFGTAEEQAFLQLGQQAGIFKGSKKDLHVFHGVRPKHGKSTARQKRS